MGCEAKTQQTTFSVLFLMTLEKLLERFGSTVKRHWGQVCVRDKKIQENTP